MNATLCFYLFIQVLIIKLISLVFVFVYGHEFFGGGNDSDYYHSYAVGQDDQITSIWPILLRFLNDIGVYSRSGVNFALVFLGVVLIPCMVAKLSVIKGTPTRDKVFWGVALLISAYPTLFYYTFDIYRDIFMVFVFLVGLFFLKEISIARTGGYKFFLYFAAAAIAYFLFLLRSYLGFAFGTALVFSGFYSFKRYPLLLSFFVLLVFLNILYAQGLLEPVLNYRSIFSEVTDGGANLGVAFSSTATFLPDLLKSTSYQLFGLYFVNFPSIIVFILESIPFIFAIVYLVRNRRYSNGFVDYIVVFFVAYSVVWLLGNDNLGTAVRLRIFNYLAVYIACMIVYQNKISFSNNRPMV